MNQKRANQFLLALGLLCLFGPMLLWPITSLTIWRNEQQGILALSWVAIIVSGATLAVQAITKIDIDS